MMKFAFINRSSLGCLAVCFGTLVLPSVSVLSAVPTTPADKAKVIGQPIALQVQPSSIILTGPRSRQQLVVTGVYADGTVRDLTPFIDIQTEAGAIVHVSDEQVILPLKTGVTNLLVKTSDRQLRVPVTVRDFDKPQPISFRDDLIAALNVGGCNSGACHGTPNGKNGFKLSLRGYDPAADYLQLTRDMMGRRTDRLDPESALMLKKALGRVPHEGGARFPASSVPGQVVRAWLVEGLQDDAPSFSPLKKVDVLPGNRVLNEPARWQQLAVMATFADGQTRDVTRLTVFTSSDTTIASVNNDGLVEFAQGGEVAILCRYLEELVPVRLTFLEPKPGFKWSDPPENNYIDTHVFAKLKMLNIQPSDLCTDQEFIRRAFMDVCGVLPTPAEVKAFLDSKDADKRSKMLIDQLLERPEYADHCTIKWSDVFRSSRKSIQLKGAHVFHTWLRTHIDKNDGFDRIISELITSSGSTFSNPAANYYRIARDPTSLAETTAQVFFGIRMQCAKCHNHPFERWTQDDYYSMSAWFARVKQRPDPLEHGATPKAKDGAEYIYVDRATEITQPRTGKRMAPKFMGGAVPALAPDKDRREVLAAWMTSPSNPFVPKSLVNRIWFHLNGRGIVDPVDDFRDSNPSANDGSFKLCMQSQGFHRSPFRCQISHSRDHEFAHVSIERSGQRLQQRRRQILLARRHQATHRRAAIRRPLPGHGRSREVRRLRARHACQRASRRRSQPPVPQNLRPTRPRTRLRMRTRRRQ